MSDARVLHFFAGKGGVGKTTLAAAFALNLAEKFPKDKVLLVSADGSHTLADLLKKKLSGAPTRLVPGKGDGGLSVAELDAATFMPAFLERYEPALRQVIGKGAVLTEDELHKILVQSVAGLEEAVFLLGLQREIEERTWNRVVVDTAPTAHTLRALDIPNGVRKLLGLIRNGEGKGKKETAPSAFLDEVGTQLEKLSALLKDPVRTSFHLVALPEPVPEAQTRMYFSRLAERGLPVAEFVVNQVEDREGCPACQGRRGLQAPHVRKLQGLDKTVPVQLIAKREVPPRSLDELLTLANEWAAGKEGKALAFAAAEGPPALVRAPSMPPIAAPPIPPTRLIFFVGQGGVGKSSCAAAAAVTLTEKEGPVLLISTDPAHSLSDVLQSRLTDTETQVKGTKGLYARELDVVGWFSGLRKRWKEKAERAFEALKPSDGAADRDLLKNLLDGAPPAIDELAALSSLTDALVQERFKRIVVDPAPAGAMVRVVDLPKVALGWLEAVHQAVSKYRARGMADLADDVGAMIKHVRRFEQAMQTPSESRFVVVTRGDDLQATRTERLVEALKERNLAVERVLVNRVLPKSTCAKCENRRKNELLAAKALEKKLGLPITVAPALGRHPAGLRELKAFRTAWYALSPPAAKIKAA
ncbi:MAG TPA: TRC40/GET3/ArsA family transport-energizing ATPase [Myxococcaceae bacterium]|nr:TRC40/GET3/ArsA family transport-energizing ATPase [Myxococcaceae bacterium]